MSNLGKKAFVNKTDLMEYLSGCNDFVDVVLLRDFIRTNSIYKSTLKRRYTHGYYMYCKDSCVCSICRLARSVYQRYQKKGIKLEIQIVDHIANTEVTRYKNDNSKFHANFYQHVDKKIEELLNTRQTSQ